MIRGSIRRTRRVERRIDDRRIRLYNIRRVRIHRPYIEELRVRVRAKVSGGFTRVNADDSKADFCGEEGVNKGFIMPINCGLGVQID